MPTQRGRGAAQQSAEAEAEDPEAVAASRKKLFVVGGVLLVLVIGFCLKVALTPPTTTGPVTTDEPITAALEPCDIEGHLAQARQYSDGALEEPDWNRALDEVNKVLDCEPIQEDANRLKARIVIEKDCKDAFDQGNNLSQRLREEEALEQYARIKKNCSYFTKVKSQFDDAVAKVKKKAGEDCKTYGSSGKWQEAGPRCLKYMEIACQGMRSEELTPPPGMKLNLWGPASKRSWTPTDPLYLLFLKARDKIDPGAPPWECPAVQILRPGVQTVDPRKDAREFIRKRVPQRELAEPLVLYFDGKLGEAVKLLQRLQETPEKAALHKTADDMRKNIANVDGVLKNGRASIAADDPEKATQPFLEALALDEALLLGPPLADETPERRAALLAAHKSNTRVTVEREMAEACYQRGVTYMHQEDVVRACKVWKLGFSIYRGNTNLANAITKTCTGTADRLSQSNLCADLNRALLLAVDGDQVKEAVLLRKEELKCK